MPLPAKLYSANPAHTAAAKARASSRILRLSRIGSENGLHPQIVQINKHYVGLGEPPQVLQHIAVMRYLEVLGDKLDGECRHPHLLQEVERIAFGSDPSIDIEIEIVLEGLQGHDPRETLVSPLDVDRVDRLRI